MTSTSDPSALRMDPLEDPILRRLVDAQLSLPARLGHVALLLAAAAMTTVLAALWLTEPALPLRTQMAFALLGAIGLSWVVYALWVLRHRRPLLAGHRIVAGRMAVTFTSLFVLGSLAVAQARGGAAPYAAAAMGCALLGVAWMLLRRAHRAFARLAERRRVLAQELGKSAG